ncbi:MAG TPA: radical SAM protein [Candidatus Deferrimicrobiaceae bacterium]|nr:radical SAM protein [Candidatus Deferrimicrobiaceae bacterium]
MSRLPVATVTPAGHAPVAPFVGLATLWVQITGTWCNLECRHCINASGPKSPWLKPLDAVTIRRAIREAEAAGVKEIYFTGGEPFLHGEILPLLELALATAPTTVLTNGTLIGPETADALAALAARAPYSLELRVSLDDTEREKNDRIRGEGAWAKAVAAVRRLRERGLLPIVTATEITRGEHPAGSGMYERFRDFLRGQGVERPRVKIMPVFGIGRQPAGAAAPLTEDDLEGFDRAVLQCADARVVAADGVYACPILAGLEGARLSTGSLAESFRPVPLYHPACVTCRDTGMTCRNS